MCCVFKLADFFSNWIIHGYKESFYKDTDTVHDRDKHARTDACNARKVSIFLCDLLKRGGINWGGRVSRYDANIMARLWRMNMEFYENNSSRLWISKKQKNKYLAYELNYVWTKKFCDAIIPDTLQLCVPLISMSFICTYSMCKTHNVGSLLNMLLQSFHFE